MVLYTTAWLALIRSSNFSRQRVSWPDGEFSFWALEGVLSHCHVCGLDLIVMLLWRLCKAIKLCTPTRKNELLCKLRAFRKKADWLRLCHVKLPNSTVCAQCIRFQRRGRDSSYQWTGKWLASQPISPQTSHRKYTQPSSLSTATNNFLLSIHCKNANVSSNGLFAPLNITIVEFIVFGRSLLLILCCFNYH